MNGLGIWLRGRGGTVGYIDADTQGPHSIHPNQDRGWFKANDYDEAGPSLSFTPLKVKVLGLPRDLEWFAVGTVDDPLERLQGTPMGPTATTPRIPCRSLKRRCRRGRGLGCP